MDNFKRFIGCFLYAIFMGYVLLKGAQYGLHMKQLTGKIYNPYPYVTFLAFYPFIVGILLAMPQFITTYARQGSWSIDWIKLVSVGLPALCLTVLPVAYFSPLGRSIAWPMFIHQSLMPQTISGVVLGYLLLAVIEKKNKDNITSD